MALVSITLATALKAIFLSMQDGSKTDAWMAAQVAAAIKTYILTGQAVTVDAGTAPAGAYAGAGSGVMTLNNSDLEAALKTTFEAAYPNDALASHMATDIHGASTENNIVSTVTVGTVTTPVGVTSPLSGMGKGAFSGDKSSIETVLKGCFKTMDTMPAGGDEYLAIQLAAAVDAYLKAGVINVTLQAPLVGAGVGSII